HRLNEEFDFSNPADAKLYIKALCVRPKPCHFSENTVSHLPQFGNRLEIEEPAEHKRAKRANKGAPFGTLPGDRPALEKHLALPRPASMQIMLDGAAHRRYQNSLIPLGAEAEIYLKDAVPFKPVRQQHR